jgi:hypothetical protein
MLSRAVAEGDSSSERCRWYSVVVLRTKPGNAYIQLPSYQAQIQQGTLH